MNDLVQPKNKVAVIGVDNTRYDSCQEIVGLLAVT
jgi:hypothetical protein